MLGASSEELALSVPLSCAVQVFEPLAKPVPFRPRPIMPVGYDTCARWPCWLVDDQREASGRPDVVAFVSSVLTTPVKIAGEPKVTLVASSSGTDSDWVVMSDVEAGSGRCVPLV